MACRLIRAALAAWLCSGAVAAQAVLPQAVEVPSLDRAGGQAILLPGTWFAVPGPAPAIVMFHGCGGLFDRQGRLAARYTGLAARLNAMGISALVTDSLTPRGEKALCTQRIGTRSVTMLRRRRDALGALQWLAAQPGVDAKRLGLLGWSNGGSTVLAATNARQHEVQAAAIQPSLAVAFYPGCDADLKRGHVPTAPLLMLLGDADDWTPAAPCKALATQAGSSVEWEAYAGAYHGFDGTDAVHLRRDVPNGAHPGAGVHLGGDAAARSASALRLEQFLRAQWRLSTPLTNP